MAIESIIDELIKRKGEEIALRIEGLCALKLDRTRWCLESMNPDVIISYGMTGFVDGNFVSHIYITIVREFPDIRKRLIEAFRESTLTIQPSEQGQ
jgi:hypothetical protein